LATRGSSRSPTNWAHANQDRPAPALTVPLSATKTAVLLLILDDRARSTPIVTGR
jgi:hypothetical protein